MSSPGKIWSNWSGSLKFTPGEKTEPENEEQLLEQVRTAIAGNKKIRVVGAGHSSSPLVHSHELFVSLRNFRSVTRSEEADSMAWIGTGLTVKEAGTALLNKFHLSFHNTGDVDVQTVAGAISTGTHGTGIRLQNLSSMLTGCRMVCADGQLRVFSEEHDGKDFFNAMRVSLGSFGIMTHLRLKLLPAFKLERREWCTHTDDCMEHLDELVENNRNFDFYWYPRNDLVKLRTLNEPGRGAGSLSYAECVEQKTGYAIEVLPKERTLKFDEMEYALPAEAGPGCFQVIRKMIKDKFRKDVAWRVLYRTIASDDFYISPCNGRNSVTISLHQNAGIPFWHYFKAIEPVFRDFGGRPHWGKKHTLHHEELRGLYPRWRDFLKIRRTMDPGGIFINEHLRQLFAE